VACPGSTCGGASVSSTCRCASGSAANSSIGWPSSYPAIRRSGAGFDLTGVALLLREQQAGGNARRAIWGLMQLAIWHRIFIEGHVPGRDEDPLEWIA
jgi:hypothetical protein